MLIMKAKAYIKTKSDVWVSFERHDEKVNQISFAHL